MRIPRRVYVVVLLAIAAIVTTACQTSDNGLNSSSSDDVGTSALPVSRPESTVAPTPNGVVPEASDDVADVVIAETLVFGRDTSLPSNVWQRPPLGEPYTDSAYQTQVTRVTSADGTRFNRNTYSRRQAENSDGTLFLTYHGSGRYHVYEVGSNELVADLGIHADSEPQWHPNEPTVLRHTSGSNASVGSLSLFETNIATGASSTIADLGERLRSTLSGAAYLTERAEGSPSEDGNRYAWMVYNGADQPIGIVSYDLTSDTILGRVEVGTTPKIDWVSMSPSGTYVVASSDAGTYVYDADLSNKRLLTEAIEHSDIGYDRDGVDAYVYIDFNSASSTDGWLVSVNMETLERTRLFDVYDNALTSVHISAKNYDKPGWVLVSSYNCRQDSAWTCDKVFAVELVPDGRIVNLAHTYNCGAEYWTETHAVVNRDFSRVYFNSDSGSCGINAEVFTVDVPSFD